MPIAQCADAWEALIETERTATVQQLWDAVYVARQLRARNAYLHCAHMPLPALRLIPQVTNPELVREARCVAEPGGRGGRRMGPR